MFCVCSMSRGAQEKGAKIALRALSRLTLGQLTS
jgi:hypothetical protein